MERFLCPYLRGEVELTDEREQHITQKHPDLDKERIAQTLQAPELVIRSNYALSNTQSAADTRLFARWYDDPYKRRYVVVVVVTDPAPVIRHWVITAYRARKVPQGEILWKRI